MKLSTEKLLIVEEEKIVMYLLNVHNPDAKAKAEFFFNNGLTIEKPEVLEELLLSQAKNSEIKLRQQTVFGLKYIFESEIEFPNKKRHWIRSVWIEDTSENIIRFVTAYKINL